MNARKDIMKRILTGLVLTITTLSLSFAKSTVDLRLTPASYDKKSATLYVSVEVRNEERSSLVLAGQNYRFFYDSDVLHLDQKGSSVDLPGNRYSQIKFAEHYEGIEADEVNQLSFDDHLGFANFSIDLTDNKNGGIRLHKEKGWTSVATLKFRVLGGNGLFDVVWGRDEATDQYATAFVELTEWKSKTETELLDINYFGDLSIPQDAEELNNEITVKIGPNPTADFIQIELAREATSRIQLNLRDLSGRIILKDTIHTGEVSKRIHVSHLVSSNYIVEMSQDQQGVIHQSQIVVSN